MPYFTFKFFPSGRLEPIAEFDEYRAAKRDVTRLRKLIAEGDDYTVRMVHAGNRAEGERLLAEKREPRPLGEDG